MAAYIYVTTTMYDEDDREILVEACVSPADPGNLNGPPENCWPSEPAHITNLDAWWTDTGEQLTVDEEHTLIDHEAIFELAYSKADDYDDDRRGCDE